MSLKKSFFNLCFWKILLLSLGLTFLLFSTFFKRCHPPIVFWFALSLMRSLLPFFSLITWVPHPHPTDAFKVFCLLLVFSNLIMLCFGEVFFMPVVLGVHSASWTCGFTVFIKFEKISTILSPCIFSVTSVLETPIIYIWIFLKFSHSNNVLKKKI